MRIRRDGYFSWTHPETHVEYGLGRNRQEAIKQVIQANMHLAAKRVSLLERIAGGANTWSEWCDVFEGLLAERESSLNTRRTRKSQMNRLRSVFAADAPAGRLDTRDCAKVIDGLKVDGKHRTAQAFRTFLIDCFDRMVAKGWRKDNPARVLDEVRVKVQRARLTLEVFDRLYERTTIGWLRNAMALMLVSGQAREDCATATFTDIHDGAWWNERGKTGARIILPLELRLDAFPLSLEDVVRQCRTTGIVSRHLIHQTERGKGYTVGKKLHVDMVTRMFKIEMDRLGLDWGGKQAPTVHEIRSLSARLYKAEGRVNPQELLGHKDPRTTAVYTDGRGEWVRVGVRK
jgi:enterobacteria phage integrase